LGNKLSFSQISSYSLCGERFRLHYRERLREKWQRSSLLFGSAMDKALNNLLATKDLEKSIEIFNKEWAFSFVNNKYTAIRSNPDVVYSERDLDTDLIELSEEDLKWLAEFKDFKSTQKWDYIAAEDRIKYNEYYWDCLKIKGEIIIRDYNKKVIPQFLSVTGIQHESYLTNAEGDTVVQYLDFVATMQDGSIVLFDNKTTSSLQYYDDESPGMSQQLISYYYNNKAKFGLTAVGFVAMQKTIIKNKTKICSLCSHDGSESRAKTCDQEVDAPETKKGRARCNGAWLITLNPECAIKVIVNPVTEAAEDLVLSTFDEANHGIKNEMFYKNLAICKNIYGSPCQFYKLCWKGSTEDLIKLEEKS
jgi:hypothetical protein